MSDDVMHGIFKIHTIVDDGVLSNDAVLSRVCLNDFELYCSHGSTDQESIALADWSVG